MTLKVGLCGFTVGASTYVQSFGVVEIQQTFYDPPPRATLERWRAQAPETFEFTMKAWQVITHADTSRTYRRLRRPFGDVQRNEAGGFRSNDTVHAAWTETAECARVLKASAILFQCPPSFRPTGENVTAMRSFFCSIERVPGVRFLWEPRGQWPEETVHDLCRELRLTHVVDPFKNTSVTPGDAYWRLHGNGSHQATYSDLELLQLLQWLPPQGERYVMFNNIPRVRDAKRFMELAKSAAVVAYS
jgi:uncharacterized protein YecE (DUF72 family)